MIKNSEIKNKGITLIALIITIIILLILAGVTISTLAENGLFEKTKIAKMRSEYASAKEKVELKLMEVQANCIGNGREYAIVEIAKSIKEDKEITIEKYYNESTSLIKAGVTENLVSLERIVVSVDKYEEYKFLLGESCEIEGVTMEEITDTITPEDFIDPEEFEKEVLGKLPSNNNENDNNTEENPKEEIKDIPAVGEDVDTTKPIGITTYMAIKTNSRNTLNLTGVENLIYTVQEKTDNVTLSGNILVANNNADSSDSCKIQIRGIYSGQSYTNNLIVYVEPKNKTTVEDKQGNNQEAYGIATKEDFLRVKEIIENINNNCNIKLIDNIELNSSDQYEFDENGKITFKETAMKYSSISSTDKPFGGIFDGNGKEISGLYIKNEDTKVSGLISMISQNGEIKNLKIKNSYMNGNRTGGITGYNEGKIYRCKVENTTIENNLLWSGGIAAINNGEIVECSTNLYICGDGLGGIVGENGTSDSRNNLTYSSTVGKVYRCYSNGYIGNLEVGSIASHNGVYGGEGYIYDCYSTAKLEEKFGNRKGGAIVSVQSYQGKGGYIYNSYYLNKNCNFTSVAEQDYYGNVTNSYSNDTTVTASKLNDTSGTAWIDDTQNINNGYPILKWQVE